MKQQLLGMKYTTRNCNNPHVALSYLLQDLDSGLSNVLFVLSIIAFQEKPR